MKKLMNTLILLSGYAIFCVVQRVFSMQGEFYDMQAQYQPLITVVKLLICGAVIGFVTVKISRAAENLSDKIWFTAVCVAINLMPPALYWSGVLIPYLFVEAASYYTLILGWYIVYLILPKKNY